MRMVETNGWNQLDHSRTEIAARDGLRPDMDRDRIWVDDQRWMTGDGLLETDDNQSPSLYEDIEVMRSYTLSRSLRFQATKLQSSADIQTYDYRRHGSND
jgi:hypothetical protein